MGSDRSNLNGFGNLKSVIALLAPLPSIVFHLYFLQEYYTSDEISQSPLWAWCYNHPFLLANILFLVNVNILFWLIGLAQSTHWMIDLYWTVIPVLLSHYYETHPLARYNIWRSRIVILLTWVWSLRLTHNYFRRESWQWGAREDWRFTDMRQQYGNNWWWISFFAIYVSQQVFLMGVCLPLYVVHMVDQPCNIWDLVGVLLCMTGITIAFYADTQLCNFVNRNKRLRKLGKPLVPNLEQGLWQYSRHPNYFGEQLWWWGLVVFAWNLGYGWVFVGSLVNSTCLAYVTVLVEQRMLKQEYRAEAYKLYQKTTSMWVPWFKSPPDAGKYKNT